MNKRTILEALLAKLEGDLHRLQAANADASAGATHSEARAETKWDTCGLEASYLARGHAQQFKKLAADVHELRGFTPASFADRPIDAGALVEVEQAGSVFVFFLLSAGGGTELEVDGREVTVITPESPVGAALIGKSEGESYTVRAGLKGTVLRMV